MNDQTSGFDPSIFLGATLTEANVRRPPIPGGLSFPGTLGAPTTRTAEGKKESNIGQVYVFCEIPVEVDITSNPQVRALVGQDKVNLRYSFRLDVKGGGALDMSPGKNNGLRILRDALDMNKQGEPFMLTMVEHRQVLCRIGNRPYQGEVYDEVESIAKIV
jgi:hypothetical protein